jgi:monofunctional biosynthetic peptidoglycan transglycosylase
VNAPPATLLCDFSAHSQVEWFNIDDPVMGGRSSSRLVAGEDATATFTGRVSLENGGGFASLRGQMPRADLRGHAGIALRVRGDGKRYGLRLRTSDRFDGISYGASFSTEAERWIEVRLPFEDFTPIFRGRTVPDADPLDLSRIEQLGLIIADEQEGDFALTLDWIGAYRDEGSPR